jgi:hypothetical protein
MREPPKLSDLRLCGSEFLGDVRASASRRIREIEKSRISEYPQEVGVLLDVVQITAREEARRE